MVSKHRRVRHEPVQETRWSHTFPSLNRQISFQHTDTDLIPPAAIVHLRQSTQWRCSASAFRCIALLKVQNLFWKSTSVSNVKLNLKERKKKSNSASRVFIIALKPPSSQTLSEHANIIFHLSWSLICHVHQHKYSLSVSQAFSSLLELPQLVS